METFVAEAVEAFLGVVSDASGVLMAKVVSLVAGIDARVASIKIGTFLLSHATVLASDTFVDVLASWLTVKRVDARSVAVRISLVETLEHADIFVSLLTSAGEFLSLRLDDRAHASPSAWIIDADAVGVDFVSAHERTGSVNAVVVISCQNAVTSKWIDALVNVEAVGWKAGIVSDVAGLAHAESNVLLVDIDHTFSSFTSRIGFSTVHGSTKSKWISIRAALVANGLSGGCDDNIDAPIASASKVTRINSSGTLVDINAASNAIDSAFSHEAGSTAVAVVLVLGGTSDEAAKAVESTPVVGSGAKTVWISRDVAVVASIVVDADAVTWVHRAVGSSIIKRVADNWINVAFINIDELPDSIIGEGGRILCPSWLSSADDGISVIKSDVS